MNLILGDVEETIYVVDINEENGAETVRVSTPEAANTAEPFKHSNSKLWRFVGTSDPRGNLLVHPNDRTD